MSSLSGYPLLLLPNHTSRTLGSAEHMRVSKGVKYRQTCVDLCGKQKNLQPRMLTVVSPEPVIVSEYRWSRLLVKLRFLPITHEVRNHRNISVRWHNVRRFRRPSMPHCLVYGRKGEVKGRRLGLETGQSKNTGFSLGVSRKACRARAPRFQPSETLGGLLTSRTVR